MRTILITVVFRPRVVAEMREIAAFLGPDDPAALMFEGAARLYDRIAQVPEPLARVIDAARPKADSVDEITPPR